MPIRAANRHHGIQGELDGHGRVDGRQTLAHVDAVDVILQALAVHLALDFGRSLDGRLH